MNDETTELAAVEEGDKSEPVSAVEVPAVNTQPSDPSYGKSTCLVSEYETAKPERKGEDPDEVKSRISPYTVAQK
jgi:hypothetical protein